MKAKKKVRFIINPISGTRSKEAIVEQIPQYLDSSRFEYDIIYTQYAGHASVLAKEAVADGIDVAVAVGGDGTVNEVARSLVHTQTALGIIPCGSGNGLARHLSIPLNATGALEILAECNIKLFDYGKINGQPFFCTCGIGFDASISKKFAEAGKRGLLTYVDSTLKSWFSYKPETYRIRFDGEEQTNEAFLIACANANQYGNNAYIAPSASMSDGLMDVSILEPFNMLEAAQVLLQLFNKTIDKNSHIRTFQCRQLHISREKEGVVHFDGEPMECGKEIDVELIHKGISVVKNAHANKSSQPVLKTIFADIYMNMSHEVERLRENIYEDIRQTGSHIRNINTDLMNKLSNKK